LPRTWERTWPLGIDPSDPEYPEQRARRERAIHQLGNLPLSTTKLNPSLSNNPWNKKRSDIQKHSVLRLTTGSVLTAPRPESDLSDEEWSSKWNEEHIAMRGQHLAREALRAWPRPQRSTPAPTAVESVTVGDIPGLDQPRDAATDRNRTAIADIQTHGVSGATSLSDARKVEVADILLNLIRTSPELLEDGHAGMTYLRFLPPAFDVSSLCGAKGWTPSGRMLLFEFQNQRDGLGLVLIVGPGDQAKRRFLIQFAAASASGLLQPPTGEPGQKWCRLYRRIIGRPAEWQDISRDDLAAELQRHWEAFIEEDLPEIVDALSGPIAEIERSSSS
jgi:hypothetical protein